MAKSTLKIEVRLHSTHETTPNQHEVLLHGRRVAYVAELDNAPIAFLPADSINLRLTTAEKIEIAEFVKAEMAKATAAARESAAKLAELTQQ